MPYLFIYLINELNANKILFQPLEKTITVQPIIPFEYKCLIWLLISWRCVKVL